MPVCLSVCASVYPAAACHQPHVRRLAGGGGSGVLRRDRPAGREGPRAPIGGGHPRRITPGRAGLLRGGGGWRGKEGGTFQPQGRLHRGLPSPEGDLAGGVAPHGGFPSQGLPRPLLNPQVGARVVLEHPHTDFARLDPSLCGSPDAKGCGDGEP